MGEGYALNVERVGCECWMRECGNIKLTGLESIKLQAKCNI